MASNKDGKRVISKQLHAIMAVSGGSACQRQTLLRWHVCPQYMLGVSTRSMHASPSILGCQRMPPCSLWSSLSPAIKAVHSSFQPSVVLCCRTAASPPCSVTCVFVTAPSHTSVLCVTRIRLHVRAQEEAARKHSKQPGSPAVAAAGAATMVE
jgi:hypothetical protein